MYTSLPTVWNFSNIHQFSVGNFVKALYHKQEGRVFDYRWCHWEVSLT